MSKRIEALYGIICNLQQMRIQRYNDDISEWIVQYAEENKFDPDLSLKLLGNEFNLSVSQVSRLFKKNTGTGFAEWLNEERIRKAKLLLGSPSKLTVAREFNPEAFRVLIDKVALSGGKI